MFLLRILIASAVLLPVAAAADDIIWQLGKKQGRPILLGVLSEPETDKPFWAHCRADGGIDIGIGAEINVGKGKGEAVTVTLTSAGASAKLTGQSRNTLDSEMTGATELRTKIARDDALFTVLATDKPIALSGSIKPTTWPVKGLKAKAAAFLAACK
jgi:hypothetical protein